MKTSHRMKRKYASAALGVVAVSAVLTAPASAHDVSATDAQAKPYTMTVIIDDAQGGKVQSGQYERAIDRLTRNGRHTPSRYADQVNLCVAYTKAKELQKAGDVCEAAIANAKQRERVVSKRARNSTAARANRADLAIALSNRGVLMAATGDKELAKQDFLAAIELDTKLTSIAESNLERLARESEPAA